MSDTQSDSGIPEGWGHNPSTWKERIPIILLALIAFVIAGYLAAYQLEIISTIWEPFFGDGSETILNSSVSHVLPIPDALLGALGYLADAVAGLIGGKRRWKSMPWIVVLFGLAVGPLGVVSITLVIFQPVLFDSWCTLCLATAVISLLMIGPAMDEVLASLQYMKRRRAEGASLWRLFWGLDEAQHAGEAGRRAPSGGQA